MQIFTIVITVLFIVQLIVCLIIGVKNGFIKSLIYMITNILSALLAIILSKLMGSILSSPFKKVINTVLSNIISDNQLADSLLKSESGISVVTDVIANAVSAIITFYILYCIIGGLLKLSAYLIYKYVIEAKISEEQYQKTKSLGAIFTMISGVITTILVLSPFAVNARQLNSSVKCHTVYKNDVKYTLSKLAGNPVFLISDVVGGRAAYNFITSSEYNNEIYSTLDELDYSCNFVLYMVDIADSSDEDNNMELFQNMKNVYNKSVLLPSILTNSATVLIDSLLSGMDIYGINLNNLNEPYKKIVESALEIVSEWDISEFVDDFEKLIDSMSIISEIDIDFSNNDIKKEIVDALTDNNNVENLFLSLSESESLQEIIPLIEMTSIETLAEKSGIKIEGNVKPISTQITKEEAKKEAEIIVDVIHAFSDCEDVNNISINEWEKIENSLDKLENSKFLSNLSFTY